MPHFSWILLNDFKIKEKIVNFKNISKKCCHKNEVGQNNWQRMGLLKKIREHEKLTNKFSKRIEDTTNENNKK